MPLYDYECEKCGIIANIIAGYDDKELTCECGNKMKRIISGNKGIAMGPAGALGYFDDNLGKYISTNKQHREECLRQGVSPKYGKGWW